ncbi:MAG TPA: hypothetical protein PLD59_01250 [Tepidisphaeraceae bacterium]|nr:hypothetical protein [Tepidisphaeraceae bacterium]
MARLRFDEQAALAAGATPLAVRLYKAHRFLSLSLLVWFGVFVLFGVAYHVFGKPRPMLDIGTAIVMGAFIVLWLASVTTLFLTNFLVRRLYVAAFIGVVFHGALLLFPLLNAVIMETMAPDMPGQAQPPKTPAASPGGNVGGTKS